MPRRFFRKFAVNRDFFHAQWYLAPFRKLLNEQNLWAVRRRTVVPAFAIGLFIGYMPFPGHPLFAALLALLFRVNLPVAAITTFVSNPLTMGPMYFLAHRLGRTLLNMEPRPFEFELSIRWVMESFQNNWQPMMLGCLILGTILAITGYIVLDLLWRASIADYVTRKRNERRRRIAEDD